MMDEILKLHDSTMYSPRFADFYAPGDVRYEYLRPVEPSYEMKTTTLPGEVISKPKAHGDSELLIQDIKDSIFSVSSYWFYVIKFRFMKRVEIFCYSLTQILQKIV